MEVKQKEKTGKENIGKVRRFRFGERLTGKFYDHVGSNTAIISILVLAGVWLVSGPYYGYSENWKFFINTAFTFITIVLVFILQRAQNKDSKAVHLKLNEIVAALKGASNRLIDAESLSEEELKVLARKYQEFSNKLIDEDDLTKPHTIEEAREQIQISLMDHDHDSDNEKKTGS